MKNYDRVLFADNKEETRSQTEAVVEDGPLGSYQATPWGQFLDVDSGLVEMLGYPDRASLMAVPADDLCVNPQDRQRWQYLMARKGVVANFELHLRRRDGERIRVSDTARAVRDSEGRLLYYEGIMLELPAPAEIWA